MRYLVCAYCGWISEAYPNDTLFAGPGGQLSCPDCSDAGRCRNIEANGFVYILNDKDFMKVLASKNRLQAIRKILDLTYKELGYKKQNWKERRWE
jgi:hypothetical protein